jgi:hypothetical protein
MNYNLFENQKFTKILTVIVFAIIIVFAFKETQRSVDDTDKEIKQLPSDVYKQNLNINKINIKTDYIPIEINNDNDKNNVYVVVHARSKDSYTAKVNGKQLDLEFNKTKCEGLCLQEEKLTISLPKNYELDFNINGTNTSINIDTINIVNNSTINLKKGTINIKSIPNTNILTNIDKGKVKVNNNDKDSLKTIEIIAEEADVTIN